MTPTSFASLNLVNFSKMFLPLSLPLWTSFATAAPAPYSCNSSAVAGVYPRAATTGGLPGSSPCSNPGELHCSGSKKFGLCANGFVTFEPVAAGTICQCNGGTCTIVAANAGGSSGSSVGGGMSAAPSASAPAVTVSTSVPTSSAAPTSTPASSAPSSVPSASASSSGGSQSSGSSPAYKMFLGNGLTAEGWPSMSDWQPFEHLWNINMQAKVIGSCGSSPGQKDNSPQESNDVKQAILAEANATGVDARFILAEGLQESSLCVRVHTTSFSVANPGLYQSHAGKGTCYPNKVPCPVSEINQMVKDGVVGTTTGPGLKQCIAQSKATGAAKYYQGAVAYNAGHVVLPLQDNTSTKCYASDIANRLLGWVGTGECKLDSWGK